MHFITHLLLALPFGFVLKPLDAIIFILSAVLVDLDHVYYIMKAKQFKKNMIYNVFSFRDFNYHWQQYKVHVFHTFETLAVLFVLGNFSGFFYLMFLGFSFHMAVDALGNIVNRNIGTAGGEDWIKNWFFTYHILKA